MTPTRILKGSMLYFSFLVATMFAMMSCGRDQQIDSKEIATDLNKPKNDIAKEQDERFLVRVAEFDYEQIMLGKLAQQRASSEDVKALAKMLEETHRASKSELSSMAIMKSIAVPSSPTKAAHMAYDKLNEASVENFDAAYLTRMVASHNDGIMLFEECIQGNNDPEIRTWAIGKLPDIRIHLTKVMELDAQYGPLSELIR
jgi:putative membrane protein